MSADRHFFDTNLFIYSVDRSDPRMSAIALRLIREALDEGNGRISYQVVQEFLNVALKKFQSAMTRHDASTYVRDEMVPMLAVEPSQRLFEESLEAYERYRLSCATA